MTESIPVNIIEGWITELQAILKGTAQESKTQTDLWINKGMRHGIAQIGSKLTIWLRHKENRISRPLREEIPHNQRCGSERRQIQEIGMVRGRPIHRPRLVARTGRRKGGIDAGNTRRGGLVQYFSSVPGQFIL